MFYTARFPSTVRAVTAPLRKAPHSSTVTALWTALSSLEAEAACEYALANGLLGVLADRLEQMGCTRALTPEVSETMRRALRDGVELDERLQADTKELVQALSGRGVDVLVLKGGAWRTQLYERPGLRPRRDIDLLIPRSAVSEAASALASLGYEVPMNARVAGQHLPRFERRRVAGGYVAVDLHHRLVPATVHGKRLVVEETCWERSVPLDLGAGMIGRTLAPLDHVVHMHLHLLHHVFYNFRFMHLYDVAMVARRWGDEVDPSAIAAALDPLGLESLVDDVRAWTREAFDDDVGEPRAPRTSKDEAVMQHLFGYGSLPDIAGLRYARGIREGAAMLHRELERLVSRWRRPEIRPPNAWSTP